MSETQRRGISAVVNAPITIFSLSVVTVGIFGAMYNDVRWCRAEANRAVQNFRRLGTEIAERRGALHRAIMEASSMKDLRASKVVREWQSQYIFLAFKGRSVKDLEDEYFQVGRLLLEVPNSITGMLSEQLHRGAKIGEMSPVRRVDFDRADFSKLTETDLPALKKVAGERNGVTYRASIELLGLKVVPECGFSAAFQRVLTGKPDHVATLRRR